MARRERRALWGTLALILIIGIAGSLSASASSRARLTRDAETSARLVAQTKLAPMLLPRDLEAPVIGDRAKSLGAEIQRRILSTGAITSIRIYGSAGRILYDADPKVVTVRPTYLQTFMTRVANGSTVSEVHDGMLQTYVPLWLTPGGTTIVAEMTQPFAPIAARAGSPWTTIVVVLSVALVAALALFALTFRASARPTAATVVVPATKAIEDARLQAEQRAKAAEAAFAGLQEQFRSTLEQLKETEARLEMIEKQTNGSDGELQALRAQLTDTAERLHKAELDNNALRERLALRQSELDEAKAKLHATQQNGGQLAELTARLELAEQRAAAMSREVEKIELELESTNDRFHMAKLSEALREFDNDDVTIEDDDLFEHPTIIYSKGRSVSAPGKVR